MGVTATPGVQVGSRLGAVPVIAASLNIVRNFKIHMSNSSHVMCMIIVEHIRPVHFIVLCHSIVLAGI